MRTVLVPIEPLLWSTWQRRLRPDRGAESKEHVVRGIRNESCAAALVGLRA
jgi:hypothetical protein